MSLRIDSTEWISGALLIGETGLGVLAENIPSTGDSGASYVYNDLSLPADAGKEICGRITTWPSAGTFTAFEDTSFTFTAPDGSYSFEYQLYVDGVATGSLVTSTLTIGTSVGTGTAVLSSIQLNPPTAAVTAHIPMASIVLTTDGSTLAANMTGIMWAWYDTAPPNLALVPTARGINAITTADGLLSLELTGTSLGSGQTGTLLALISDGVAGSSTNRAFCAPVVVT